MDLLVVHTSILLCPPFLQLVAPLISQQLIATLQVYSSNSQSSRGGTDWWKLYQQAQAYIKYVCKCINDI